MFHDSTQKKHWLLASCAEIIDAQSEANRKYIEYYSVRNCKGQLPEFLTSHEERQLLTYYSHHLIDVSRKFQPPVPMSVVGTSMTYFRRFYLNVSVMEFHPRDVVYLCVYLACKVEEYNVSIDQFMWQVAPEEPFIAAFVLDNELLLLQKLHFHLTVHNPFRPLEGFIIDMKAKRESIPIADIEHYRVKVEQILSRALLTDLVLLYSPSQIALACLRHCTGRQIDSYIMQITPSAHQSSLFGKLGAIQDQLNEFKFPSMDEVRAIERKLSKCRDLENDPKAEGYHARDKKKQEQKSGQKRKIYEDLANLQRSEEDILHIKD